ncbi:MAG: GNAT family N-acetyltransferase [Anaerolineaceae bacterium]|nr:GNAT family N-acetyltransferase [Anaerolineaceae bacterium]
MPKRIALVTDRGEPVAVIGLRPRGYHWEPLTQWLLPGGLFVARPGYSMRALKRLGLDIWAAWWRMPAPPEESSTVRWVQSTPTYRMDLSQDYESFWRSTGIYKTIRKVRNRCSEFTFEVNHPGAAEWTIRNWETRWRADPNQETPQLHDRLYIARILEYHCQHFSFSLHDQGDMIAGATVFVQKDTLVAGVNYRKPEYDWHGVNERLIELVFSWATAAGYKTFDIGGGHEYKQKWAPQAGERWYINTCPGYIHFTKQAVQKIMSVKNNLPLADKESHPGLHQINTEKN